MNNVAIIEAESPAHPRITWMKNWPPNDEQVKFAREICETLGSHLQPAGCQCTPAQPDLKFGGACFDARMTRKRFRISIGAERKTETLAEITVWAEPHIRFLSVVYPPFNNTWKRWNKKIWEEFGRHFKNAVESQFPGCPVKWMTEAEWLAELPEEQLD